MQVPTKVRLWNWLSVCVFILGTSFAYADPIFPNSVASNDLEFIRSNDPGVFSCLAFQGTEQAEMPDKRSDDLFDSGTFIFQANYKDGTSVGLWAHSDFGSQSTALQSVEPVARAIGKLPTFMRSKLDHVVIHKGDEVAFGEADGHFFVLYSDNIHTRIRNHDLEETVFHESVHATLDATYLSNRAWRNAQLADGAYVTEYAARRPEKEDMAESALFAWTMLVHPGRLPQSIESQVRQIMPNRLAFFEDLFLQEPIFRRVGKEHGC
jgi:hypothetical protein